MQSAAFDIWITWAGVELPGRQVIYTNVTGSTFKERSIFYTCWKTTNTVAGGYEIAINVSLGTGGPLQIFAQTISWEATG